MAVLPLAESRFPIKQVIKGKTENIAFFYFPANNNNNNNNNNNTN